MPDPLSLFGFAIAGATAKKRTTRRSEGKVAKVPMYLDSEVHVMRDDKLEVVRGGVLLDDTDLDEEEIESIQGRGVIRPATPAEIEQLAQADKAQERAAVTRTQQTELQSMQARQASEMAGATNAGKSDADKAKLSEKHAEALTALQEKHTAALNDLSE